MAADGDRARFAARPAAFEPGLPRRRGLHGSRVESRSHLLRERRVTTLPLPKVALELGTLAIGLAEP